MTIETRDDYLARHWAEIQSAHDRIRPYTRWTPTVAVAEGLIVKLECLQVTGAFKVRGAFNAMLQIMAREPRTKGVVTISSGNHATAVALAARTLGVPAVILIPEGASRTKVAATRALGAEIIQAGVTFQNREQLLAEIIVQRDLSLVHPYDDWDIIHGQATAGLELIEDRPDLAMVVVPISGGGLISGTALAVKALRPDILVVGVEPREGDDAARSFRSRRIERLPHPPATMADAARALAIGARNFEVMVERRLLDAIVTVGDDQIADALGTAWLDLKFVVEPTSAMPLAAYLNHLLPKPPRAGPVALLASGGNVDPQLIAQLLAARAA